MFEGLRVAEFAWVGVGPFAGGLLANYGATVVRVESVAKPDMLRTMAPFKDGRPGVDRSGFFAFFNPNKLSLALNLHHPKGRAVAGRLMRWADVVTESFTPGTMANWGLGYEGAKAVNEDVIYLSTAMQGQTGPHRLFRGFGVHPAALAGFYHLAGYADRAPAGPYGAYSDFVASIFGQALVLSALLHRRRTGEGLHIDLSQLEASVHFLTPVMLDYAASGHLWQRKGNKDDLACPHDVYPCAGDDAWIAIAVTADEEWRGLCATLECGEWLADERFATLAARRQHEGELDPLLAEMTKAHDPFELMRALQANGVPAGVVQKTSQVLADPQLAARGRFTWLPHREIGDLVALKPAFQLSACPPKMERAAPCLGEHTEHVLRDLLGMSDEEIAELVGDGVLE